MTNVVVSINYAPATPGAPESVFGIVRHDDGSETPYGGWLALLSVLQTAASTEPELPR
jgi:hypothetical protein